MTNIYNAIAWYFDISYYEAIDIYDEMKSLGEDRQIEQIRRDYLKAHTYYDTDDALADYEKKRLCSVYGRFADGFND